jgi:hypothetical protein
LIKLSKAPKLIPTLDEVGAEFAAGAANEDEEYKHCAKIRMKPDENFLLDMSKIVNRNWVAGKVKTFAFSFCTSWLIFGCAQSTVSPSRFPDSVKPNADERVQNFLSQKIEFEKCEQPHRLYLEKQMNLFSPEYLRGDTVQSPNKLPVQCIQVAQKNHYGAYAVCDKENDKPKISYVRPCRTEAYVNLTYNAYHDVMDCFNLDPREMFYQIMIESGFHPNAINRTGFDSGLAQFTGNGIKRVQNVVNNTQRVLLESSRPSCQRIASIVGHFDLNSASLSNRCVMIAFPANPYRSMFFAYLHTRLDMISMEEYLADVTEIQEALTDKIRRQFLYLSYNRGMTGFKTLLQGYINSRNYFRQKITESDLDLGKNLTRAKEIMNQEPEKRELLKRAKVLNLSFAEYAVINNVVYLSEMSAARDYVERYLGNSCGEF